MGRAAASGLRRAEYARPIGTSVHRFYARLDDVKHRPGPAALTGLDDCKINRLKTGNLQCELAQRVFSHDENGFFEACVLAETNFSDRMKGKCKLHNQAGNDSISPSNLIPEAPSCQFASNRLDIMPWAALRSNH